MTEFHVFTMSGCSLCRKLKASEAFRQAKVDLDVREHRFKEDQEEFERFGVKASPTMVIVEGEEDEKEAVNREVGADDVHDRLKRELQVND